MAKRRTGARVEAASRMMAYSKLLRRAFSEVTEEKGLVARVSRAVKISEI